MRFILETDYPTIIRNEVRNLLSTSYSDNKLIMAELMAIAQIKNYIKGSYDVDAIFTPHIETEPPTPDTRNAFIVMITIDCALYHLYSNTAPDRIPEHRSQRYQDALEWLKSVAKGETTADLPTDEETGSVNGIKISSKYKKSTYRY
ncbi:MAG TPA: DUF1320 family protein [Crocinitomicaceae bacterium]|nr:DUF1320 family protein [Crocinitomicaceae bacterium]